MRIARLLAPLAALGLLAGCHNPQTALTVNGEEVTMADVRAARDDCRTVFAPATDREIEVAMSNALLANKLAFIAQRGLAIEVTDADRQRVLVARNLDPALLPQQCLRHLNGRLSLDYLLATKGPQEVSASLKGVEVEVNPALGKFDPVSLYIAQESTSLSTPLARPKVQG